MTSDEENALIMQYADSIHPMWHDNIRLAIRAAHEAGRLEGAAQERERCAYICDRWDGTGEVIAEAIAAAIRRGE